MAKVLIKRYYNDFVKKVKLIWKFCSDSGKANERIKQKGSLSLQRLRYGL